VLSLWMHNPLYLGLAQAGVVIILSLVATWIARYYHIHMEREVIIALARAFIQVIAVGSVLLIILKGPLAIGFLILAGMMVLAAQTAARRAKEIPDVFRVSLYAIAVGSGTIIVLMTWIGVIHPRLTSLIPVGSMLLANAMNTSALALERFRSEVKAHVGLIETALALGAEPTVAVAPYVEAAVHASLIPRINSLRSLGIVWIPGVMTGMLLGGSDPVYAAVYQFVVMGMIFSVSALTSLISVLLVRSKVFSPAGQLLLRPGLSQR